MSVSYLEKYKVSRKQNSDVFNTTTVYSTFHKMNKLSTANSGNTLNAKSVVLGYNTDTMHGDVYNSHQLRVIDDEQLMTERFIDDALLQAMPHIKHTLIQFFSVMKFCLVYLLAHTNQEL